MADSCTEFRSPNCWANLNVMLDKGVKPPANFLHAFFRPGPRFNVFMEYPEYAQGVDRLLKLGVDINARDVDGKTVLGRLMSMPNNPETLKALIARGAKL